MTVRSFETWRPVIGSGVYIDPSAVVIGDVTLDDDTSVWPMATIRGDVNRVAIGAETNVQDGAVLHVTHAGDHATGFPLSIGRGVTIGHRAVVHGCTIGDHCLIGIGAILMDGAIVEDRVLTGAGSLVPPGKRLASGHLYVGTPARQARQLSDSELDFLRYSAKHYVTLKNRYLQNGSDDG